MDKKDIFTSNQTSLFSNSEEIGPHHGHNDQNIPLAYRARPTKLSEYYGQEHIFTRFPFLGQAKIPSMVLWGPPGTGKTTLAGLLAKASDKKLFSFNAVLGGVNDLKKLIHEAVDLKQNFNTDSLIFIDEIHRFNKAQQDALLPYVEAGAFTLIGATTENPKVSVNRALLSRLQIIELKKLSIKSILLIIKEITNKFKISASSEILNFLAEYSNGDARTAINSLEYLENSSSKITLQDIQKIIMNNNRDYDKNHNRHYDVISAFIKSMRGSDPQAAILWLAVMIDGGEDPVFIARRIVVFASEDIGNADPAALTLATATLTAVQNIGMPEARINLGQAVTYMASTVKSNASYLAINEALEYVRANPTIEVPTHLQNHHPDKKNYLYPHSFPEHFIKQKYTVDSIPEFYKPCELGREKILKERLRKLWS